ncbi:M15 family metallopeptidase [Shewanella sp. D64]|uniref:M15 family metallopeptidase n=1 Tax=unclassified Shewanella TaxID=196818 RepID=UPI0022BA2E94|nr:MULTISPECIES: M15 family metallopeptidase [unclassified Shewanella]MEC4724211.1 M15 family metallopeptidase [Shewanella sp. D64]MEC4736231.1 M15 family metallopeptidase [Shewanella sp. E94]WBJ97837.1 M15 family metallopeptidase [Shewanella sp. MTB7]
MLIDSTAIYGLESSHLVDYQGHKLEQYTAEALTCMRQTANLQGIDIAVCSGHRSFDKQLHIWNGKALGKRTLLDIDSQPVSITDKSGQDLVDLILLWSALPGTSRHHWGTDLDLYDANAIERSKLALISSEYQAQGPCSRLHTWLVQHSHEFGFYFPFQLGLSGVSPEPWHLSYFPVANKLLNRFKLGEIESVLHNADIELKSELMAKLPYIVNEYVRRVAPSPSIVQN